MLKTWRVRKKGTIKIEIIEAHSLEIKEGGLHFYKNGYGNIRGFQPSEWLEYEFVKEEKEETNS